jgi:hypothetical protein
MTHTIINRTLAILLATFAFACTNTPVVYAKSTGPVTIDYSVPKNIKAGSQVTTSISFTAKTDMHLVMSASAYRGLDLISGGEEVVVNDLKRGESHTMDVTIRLNDAAGYLAVYAATTDANGRVKHKNIAIRYGDADANATQKMTSEKLSTEANGETLILMPAEAR